MCFVSQLTPCPAEGCFFACPAASTAQPLGAGCLLAAMPLRDSLCPAGAVPLYGWGVPLAGKRFSANYRTFAGADILSPRQRNFTNLLFPSAKRVPFPVLLVAACPAGDCFFAYPAGATAQPLRPCRLTDGTYPLRVKPLFLLQESGVFLPCSCFLPARQGPKPLFLLLGKRKSGSGLRKRKGRPVEMITDCGTTERWCYAVMVSLG